MASFGTVATGSTRSDGLTLTANNDGDGVLIVTMAAVPLGGQTPSATWNGSAMTAVVTAEDSLAQGVRIWKHLTPDTGSHDLVIAGLTNDRHNIVFIPTNGTSDVSASDSDVIVSAQTMSVTLTGVSGDLGVYVGVGFGQASDPTVVPSPAVTFESEAVVSAASAAGWGWTGGRVLSSTTGDESLSWTSTDAPSAMAGVIVTASGGGSTQPPRTYYSNRRRRL